MAEDFWIERAQSAEAKLGTCQDQIERLKEKYRNIVDTFAAKERSDGTIDIDFAKLAGLLSLEHALELRSALDETHRISGTPGEKPRVKVSA